MADNINKPWEDERETSKDGVNTNVTHDYAFDTINAWVASNIPPYSQINSATLDATADKDPNGSLKYGFLKVGLHDGSGSYLAYNLFSKEDLTYKGVESITGVDILRYIRTKASNSGYIVVSGYNSIRVWMGFTAVYKQGWKSTAKINYNYNEPRAIVSVSKTGEGTVTGAGTYHYNTNYTITATAAAGWKFVKWSDGDKNASRTFTVNSSLITAYETQKSYQAIFEKLTYTVTWKNYDGTVLETDNNVEYGAIPTYNGATPIKASTAQHSYAFSGWSPALSVVTGNATYTAQFTATVRKYTVRWYNYDGTLLETDTDVPYGTKPTYNGETPTKPSDDYYNYGFAGWSPSVDETIVSDMDFMAQFAQTDRYYTVRWLNASAEAGVEGELLETDEVLFNTQPDYNGTEPVHPLQDTDPEFEYTFIGWAVNVNDPAKPDTELETVKGNITYTAIYQKTKKLYAITVILFDTQYTEVYEYGTEITIEAPAVTGYQFVKWSDGVEYDLRSITVTGSATYTAIFEKILSPEITSVQMLYSNKQISAENKVPAGEFFRIVVGAVAYDS